jgi:hypothetical protein
MRPFLRDEARTWASSKGGFFSGQALGKAENVVFFKWDSNGIMITISIDWGFKWIYRDIVGI